MRGGQRRSATRVKDGRVQRKNNWAPDPSDHWRVAQPFPLVIRERPGEEHRHVLTKRDVHAFIELLPDWAELSRGLDAIVLAEHDDCLGWCGTGVIGICAWPWDLWEEFYIDLDRRYLADHRPIFERLGVPLEPAEVDGRPGLRALWTVPTVRAFLLLHVFLHELGHHHDRMTSRAQRNSGRGEPYAERYALEYEALIWGRYLDRFGLD